MTVDQILGFEPALTEFLGEFDDCFGRSEPRQHLKHNVRGQLSNLQRKSVEPIALFNNVAPRTLQEYLNSDVWDHPHARDRVQHGAETRVAGAERELHGDDAVGGLAQPAAILPLHAGGFLAGLGMARVVDDADGLGILMVAGDDLRSSRTASFGRTA